MGIPVSGCSAPGGGRLRRPGWASGVGLAEDAFDDLAVIAGLDVSGTLLAPTAELPIGFIWLLGAGIGVGDEVLLSFPAGISGGSDLEVDGILFRPYVTPRVSLDIRTGPGDELDLAAAVDLGLDLAFSSAWGDPVRGHARAIARRWRWDWRSRGWGSDRAIHP